MVASFRNRLCRSAASAFVLISLSACASGNGLSLSAANPAANASARGAATSGTSTNGGVTNANGSGGSDSGGTGSSGAGSSSAASASNGTSTNPASFPNTDADPSATTTNVAPAQQKFQRAAATSDASSDPQVDHSLVTTADGVVARVDDAGGQSLSTVLHMAGNAILATGEDVSAMAATTPIAGLVNTVAGSISALGQSLAEQRRFRGKDVWSRRGACAGHQHPERRWPSERGRTDRRERRSRRADRRGVAVNRTTHRDHR